MKKRSALPVLALLCLATMPLASAQNLPVSMAFPDLTPCGNIEFLDVSFPTIDEIPTHHSEIANSHAVAAHQPSIAHSSAAVLSALGLFCMARRKR